MGWIRIRMDPELLPGSWSGTRKIQSWIWIRNKSFRIHNTGYDTNWSPLFSAYGYKSAHICRKTLWLVTVGLVVFLFFLLLLVLPQFPIAQLDSPSLPVSLVHWYQNQDKGILAEEPKCLLRVALFWIRIWSFKNRSESKNHLQIAFSLIVNIFLLT